MDNDFVRNRITALRMLKGISEYKMSLDLGHSKSYIQGISSGRALPSMLEFLYICEYLGIHPREFFDEALTLPTELAQLNELAKDLNQSDLRMLCQIARRLKDGDSTPVSIKA